MDIEYINNQLVFLRKYVKDLELMMNPLLENWRKVIKLKVKL